MRGDMAFEIGYSPEAINFNPHLRMRGDMYSSLLYMKDDNFNPHLRMRGDVHGRLTLMLWLNFNPHLRMRGDD